MPVILTVEDATASDLLQALQSSSSPPEEEPPVVDFTEIEARITALEQRKIWRFNSGNSSEKRTSLPVNGTRYVIYNMKLPALKAGDLIDARVSFEITNPHEFNVMVGRQLIMGNTHLVTSGVEISEAATRNITPGMHHDHIQDFGTYVVPQDAEDQYITVAAWSASSAASSGDTVVLEQDYGRLEVTVTPASMLAN